MQAMSSAGSSQPEAELRVAVAEMFSVFQRLFTHRWTATFNDDKARPAWFAALRAAGLTAVDVRAGMARASQLEWPPTAGEFVKLCRPAVPSSLEALTEAATWARGAHDGAWSHPAVGAAARAIGSWKLRNLPERDLAALFGNTYGQMVERHHRGEILDVPPTLALPAEIRTTTPRGAAPPAPVAAAIAECASRLGVSL